MANNMFRIPSEKLSAELLILAEQFFHGIPFLVFLYLISTSFLPLDASEYVGGDNSLLFPIIIQPITGPDVLKSCSNNLSSN